MAASAALPPGPRAIDDLAADPANPRTIAAPAAVGLRKSLARFGDLSGLVYNERTGQLVAGHQRLAQLRAAGATLWIPAQGEAPGYVAHPETGERFPVRVVDWDARTQRAANLAANNSAIAGDWTADALDQLLALQPELPDFDELRLDALLGTLQASAPPQEFPEHDESATA